MEEGYIIEESDQDGGSLLEGDRPPSSMAKKVSSVAF